MALYAYTIKTIIGSADGTMLAESENEVRAKLAADHSGEFTDDDGEQRPNEVEEIQVIKLSDIL